MVLSRLSISDRNNIASAGVGADVHTAANEFGSVSAVLAEETAISDLRTLQHADEHAPKRHVPKLPPTGVTGGIIFGSDQGMCGRFNEQIASFAVDSLTRAANEVRKVRAVLCVGHRVSDNVTSGGLVVDSVFRLSGSAGGITSLAQDLLPMIDRWRATHEINRILVFHNRRLSASTGRPFVMQLLSLRLDRFLHETHAPHDSATPNRSLPT